MTKFKVGDKVRVRKDLEAHKIYGSNSFTDSMAYMKGETATISEIIGNEYRIKECGYNWTDEMFENNLINSIGDLRFGDILTLRNDERYVFVNGFIYGEDDLNDCDCDEVEDHYKANLTRKCGECEYDITKIEREGQVVFEREEILEVTMKEVCEKFGQEVKIVKENA